MCDDQSTSVSPLALPSGGEATYSLSDQPTNQPTDQPTEPTGDDFKECGYVSVRITIEHSRLSDVQSVFSGENYCLWPHTGSKGDNPHFHVLLYLPFGGDDRKYVEKIRKRIKDKLGLVGAGKVMLKLMSNPLVEAVTYCSKESTQPVWSRDIYWRDLVSSAPKWVDKVQQPIQPYLKGSAPRKLLNEDHFYQITYQNMEKVTLRYHKRHGTPPDLASTLEHMHKNGWRLNVAVIRGGIPSTYFDEFEAKCKNDTIWKKSRFEFMRVVPNYSRGL